MEGVRFPFFLIKTTTALLSLLSLLGLTAGYSAESCHLMGIKRHSLQCCTQKQLCRVGGVHEEEMLTALCYEPHRTLLDSSVLAFSCV